MPDFITLHAMQHSEFSHRTALISKEVCELLRAHDCVILPGFGGFVSGYAPASVHPVTHVFQPPHKHVLFNRNLKTDDGLLLNRLLPNLLLSYQEGRDWPARCIWAFEHSTATHSTGSTKRTGGRCRTVTARTG